MEKTLVGVFDDRAEAEQVRNQLVNLGLSTDDITIQGSDASTTASSGDGGHHGGVLGWFRNLFDMDDDASTGRYAEAVRRGSYVVSATAYTDEQADRIATVMDQHGAVNLDHRETRWREQGWSGYQTGAPALSAGELAQERELNLAQRTRVPVVEETLAVGKRAIERGGVRVFTRLVERPVEERVTLREEHAVVERHAVDRPVTDADLAALDQGTIEVRETVEEPVVQKTARVVEEIEVGKRVDERVETVRDTVRHTEVQVDENVAAGRVPDPDATRPGAR